jgi:hypothetical protein
LEGLTLIGIRRGQIIKIHGKIEISCSTCGRGDLIALIEIAPFILIILSKKS